MKRTLSTDCNRYGTGACHGGEDAGQRSKRALTGISSERLERTYLRPAFRSHAARNGSGGWRRGTSSGTVCGDDGIERGGEPRRSP
ncbi:MAG: hypothetical protein LBP19_00230 [Treponema sp.]|nr:hypothetical protein [Treponema sp.]